VSEAQSAAVVHRRTVDEDGFAFDAQTSGGLSAQLVWQLELTESIVHA
jgi:hypothetical protein